MQVVKTKVALRSALKSLTGDTKIVLVPTMGALHEGHYTLIEHARELAGEDGIVVVSLFVNPIQFNNAGDLQHYPRTFDEDKRGCEQRGVDILFVPENEDMYDTDRSVEVVENNLSLRLCGASRPGHFTGVCTVVAKLFNLVSPTDAVFGEKDFQQLAIIRRMVRDLDFPLVIHGVPIVRGSDGLALSSRNTRLSQKQKRDATILYKALTAARHAYHAGETTPDMLISLAGTMIKDTPSAVQIDYIDLFDADTLVPVETVDDNSVMALAVFFGEVRLIDNISFKPSTAEL